jgi:outer membrane protein TolC
VQGLFKRRPDVREAERKLAASVARIGVATAALYPTVTIAPSAATAAVRPSGLTDLRNVSYGLGPMLTWSFPNTLPARAMVGEARAQASAATAAFDGAVLQALQDVEGALTAYAAELDRNRALMAARDQSQTALRLAQAQFQAGSASFLDVLSAQSVYVQSLQTLAASDEAVASDQVTAFKALGGGWEQAPSVTAPPIIDRRTGKAEPVR